MEKLYIDLGRRIASAREKAGLTQERLAARVGMSRTSVVNIEAGRQRLALHNLYRVADALALQLNELLPSSPSATDGERLENWVAELVKGVGDVGNR